MLILPLSTPKSKAISGRAVTKAVESMYSMKKATATRAMTIREIYFFISLPLCKLQSKFCCSDFYCKQIKKSR